MENKDKAIEEIINLVHNMVDVEDIKSHLEALYQLGFEVGYAKACEDAGMA